MMRPLLHPRWRTHVTYADGAGTAAERRVHAEHLMKCPRCRGTQATLGGLLADAARLAPLAPPATAWDAISARLDAGEHVLLAPVDDTSPARVRIGRMMLAIAVAAALVLLLPWTSTRTIYSASSELHLYPRPGTRTVDLRYTNPARCRGCTSLVVRARWRHAADERASDEIPVVSAGTLRLDGEDLVGALHVPEDAIIGFVSLESPDARWTDDNDGRAWMVEPATAGARPLEVHRALINDLADRDWEGALTLSRELTSTFPDSITAWTDLTDRERRLPRDTASMARDRATLARFEVQARGVADDGSGEIAARMFRLGWSVLDVPVTNDTSTLPPLMRYWLGRLSASRIASPRARHIRLLVELQGLYDRPHAALARLEQRWREDSSDYLLVSEGIRTSRRASDTTAAIRWWQRLAQVRPSTGQVVATRLSQLTPSRAEGIASLRRFVADSGDGEAWRALGESRMEFRRAQQSRVARANMALSNAHLADGNAAAGERALMAAAGAAWHTAALEALAARMLARGDTLRALQSLAMLSADPSRTAGFADSVRARTGRFHSAGVVAQWRDSGAVLLRAHLLGGVKPVVLAGPLTSVRTEGGSTVDVAGHRGAVLISFWSTGCAPSIEELPALAAVLPAVVSRGLAVLVVSRTRRDAAHGGDATLAAMPFAVDADGSLHRAVRQWMTPERVLVMPGSAHRAWRVTLPVSELPLLAAALRTGMLSQSMLP